MLAVKAQTKNTIWSVIQHLIAIVCGMILPREILTHYGSEMNGLVHSISQFLSYTVLLEFGIGAVIPAAMYRPLAEGDNKQISAIISSGYKVYRRLSVICIWYIGILLLVFPALTGMTESTQLIIVLGLGVVVHYFVGIPEQVLIISDQKGYVVYRLAAVSALINTIIQVALIRTGNTLAVVKLAGTLISIGQIIVICFYVKTHYSIDRKIKYDTEPIPQKWNGIAQHVAYFILENTDIILLTVFMTFREVSVYSIYFMVISGVRRIFDSITYSVQPKLGELRARGDQQELNRFFRSFEKRIHISSVIVFGALSVVLVPFVKVYTDGVTDANYIRPLFAILMSIAYGFQSIRDPYDKLILASGHFKQTQKNYIVAASLNLGISLIAVHFWGLEGVAAGTLIAMAYQMIYMSIYDTKALLKRSWVIAGKQFAADGLILALTILIATQIPFEDMFRWALGFFRG